MPETGAGFVRPVHFEQLVWSFDGRAALVRRDLRCSVMVLFAAALVLRAYGAVLRDESMPFAARLAGSWAAAAVAWVAVAIAGGWSPVWPVLGLGAAAGIASLWLPRVPVAVLVDVATVAISAALSVPMLGPGRAALVAACVVPLGLAIEAVSAGAVRRMPGAAMTLPALMLGGPAVLLVLLSLSLPGTAAQLAHTLGRGWMSAGLATPLLGQRIELRGGAVGWLQPAYTGAAHPAALLLHGMHPDASAQPAAVVLRRALLEAGFAVLSLDRPGYGASPLPRHRAAAGDWDVSTAQAEAIEALSLVPGVERVFVVGHSLGGRDALRLIGLAPKVAGIVTFGAAATGDSPADEAYWYERFHADQRIHERLPRALFHEVYKRDFAFLEMIHALPPVHAPVLFVRFGHDNPDVEASRDMLFDAIPGPRVAWDFLPSTHYFNALGRAGIVLGDTRTARIAARRLAEFAASTPGDVQLAGRAGTPSPPQPVPAAAAATGVIAPAP
ncbi:MAG: alpha/beta fold hydrolase [Acidobacteria bacterium]|nr:alpha/beta fold hydrolase [Acidobacteriota bacterium]